MGLRLLEAILTVKTSFWGVKCCRDMIASDDMLSRFTNKMYTVDATDELFD